MFAVCRWFLGGVCALKYHLSAPVPHDVVPAFAFPSHGPIPSAQDLGTAIGAKNW